MCDPLFSMPGYGKAVPLRPRQKFQAIEKTAIRKLFQLHVAKSLNDLRSPGNSREALTRDRIGQHAIRINQQFRLCFVWNAGDAFEVEVWITTEQEKPV